MTSLVSINNEKMTESVLITMLCFYLSNKMIKHISHILFPWFRYKMLRNLWGRNLCSKIFLVLLLSASCPQIWCQVLAFKNQLGLETGVIRVAPIAV